MSSKRGPILPEENSYMVRDAFYSFNVNVIFDKKQVESHQKPIQQCRSRESTSGL